jgi:hypothetical protein
MKSMAAPQTTLWQIDRHTQAKHEILRRYLEAWFPILSHSSQKVRIIPHSAEGLTKKRNSSKVGKKAEGQNGWQQKSLTKQND